MRRGKHFFFTLNGRGGHCLFRDYAFQRSKQGSENSRASSSTFLQRLGRNQRMMGDVKGLQQQQQRDEAISNGAASNSSSSSPSSKASLLLMAEQEEQTQTQTQTQPQALPIKLCDGDGKHYGSCLEQSYSEQIRPLLDVVDRLRNLNIMSQGIDLPSIVVIGDQSSGKSSVLESLSCVSLPKGDGICTRVPLVLRLQNSCNYDDAAADDEKPQITISYLDQNPHFITEHTIPEHIAAATDAIAGTGKGISGDPITLHIVRRGAPDLTLIDLPGITRVPLRDQPQDIYEQIKDLILRYISPAETIILNVLSAHIDFPTAESVRWSKQVDTGGQRTLTVVTKCDERQHGLCERITANVVDIVQGYICVRNRLHGETLAEARKKEAELFSRHPLLRGIDKSMVGIPALAAKLMQMQAAKIHAAIPTLLCKVDAAMAARQREIKALPPPPACRPEEAHVVFVKLLHSMADTLRRLILDSNAPKAFTEDVPEMGYAARLRGMYERFLQRLQKATNVSQNQFLARESELLKQARGEGLPNFLPRAVFRIIVQGLVESVAPAAEELVGEAWDYLQTLVHRVVGDHCWPYPALQASVQKAVMEMVQQEKQLCLERVREMLVMEQEADFTLSPSYDQTHAKMLQYKSGFLDTAYYSSSKKQRIDGIGNVDGSFARSLPRARSEAAYDMAISVEAYWQVVTLRLGDGVPLLLQFRARELVTSKFERTLLEQFYHAQAQEKMGKFMAESNGVSSKRSGLRHSIEVLEAAKTALTGIFTGHAPMFSEYYPSTPGCLPVSGNVSSSLNPL